MNVSPKETEVDPIFGKDLASVFWHLKGILLIDYHGKCRAITGEYYASLLNQLDAKIREKSGSLKKKRIILHQDNEIVYKCTLVLIARREICRKIFSTSPIFPDLTLQAAPELGEICFYQRLRVQRIRTAH